jgi:hypothetical protein
MWGKLRKRLTFTNVVLTLILFFAMTGGALAAKHYLITSTKQISPTVLKALKGAAGARGPAGAAGAAGAQGPQGPQGAAGTNGTNGTDGTDGTAGTDGTSVTSTTLSNGNEHCKAGGSEFTSASGKTYACNGKAGTFEGGSLPSGATETGAWSVEQIVENQSPRIVIASFAIPLSAPLKYHTEQEEEKHEGTNQVHFIAKNGKEILLGEPEEEKTSTECHGTVEDPTAEPGNLCIYTDVLEKLETASNAISNPATGTEGASQVGAAAQFIPTETGGSGSGTWAVAAG